MIFFGYLSGWEMLPRTPRLFHWLPHPLTRSKRHQPFWIIFFLFIYVVLGPGIHCCKETRNFLPAPALQGSLAIAPSALCLSHVWQSTSWSKSGLPGGQPAWIWRHQEIWILPWPWNSSQRLNVFTDKGHATFLFQITELWYACHYPFLVLKTSFLPTYLSQSA